MLWSGRTALCSAALCSSAFQAPKEESAAAQLTFSYTVGGIGGDMGGMGGMGLVWVVWVVWVCEIDGLV